MLGITLAAKDKLPSRSGFYDKSLEIISARRGSIESATKLLQKYK